MNFFAIITVKWLKMLQWLSLLKSILVRSSQLKAYTLRTILCLLRVDVARVQIYESFVFLDYSCVEDRLAELSAAKFRLNLLWCREWMVVFVMFYFRFFWRNSKSLSSFFWDYTKHCSRAHSCKYVIPIGSTLDVYCKSSL